MPSRDEVKPQVIEKIKAVTNDSQRADNEDADLERDLGIGSMVKQALARTYTDISRQYPTGLEVSVSDAGDRKKVKDSIDLVHKRSNGDQS